MGARSRATRKRGFTFDDEGLGPGGFKDQSADQVLPRLEGVRSPEGADPSHWNDVCAYRRVEKNSVRARETVKEREKRGREGKREELVPR